MRQQPPSRINRKSGHISFATAPETTTLRPLKNLSPPVPTHMRADLVEEAAKHITEYPILINLVSKRVRQIASGRSPLVDRRPGLRDADLALLEIIQGKITPLNIDDN